jgi:hypothetical protein
MRLISWTLQSGSQQKHPAEMKVHSENFPILFFTWYNDALQ